MMETEQKTAEQRSAEIYEKFHGKIRNYFRSRVSSSDLAEELTSVVFLKVCEKQHLFDEKKAALSTWVYTIARNTLIDYFRTAKTTEEIPEDLEDDFSVEEEICRKETLEKLAGALKKLDERSRDLVILRYYSGLKLTEIAERMNLSYSYIKILHNTALAALRKEMEE